MCLANAGMNNYPRSRTVPLLKVLVALLPFSSVLSAQFGTELVADQDIGRPRQPPFISFLGAAALGRMATDPYLPPKGPVAEVLFEELRVETSPGGAAGEVMTSVKTKYDLQGRAIEEIRKEYGAETDTINRYQGTRLVSQETAFPSSKSARSKCWNYWIYDEAGKLTEYKRGCGDIIQNHDTNFKRDQQGRLTSFDYRQGEKDELFSRTEFHYSPDGKTIDISRSYATGDAPRLMTQTVDEQGQVVQVVIREQDWRTKKPKPPLKVAFSYDKDGRLTEQNTDPYDVEPAGGEHELPPGKVSITYDDYKHTKTTVYSGKEGSLFSIVTYDSTEAAIGAVAEAGGGSFETNLECTYDSHGNWASCQQIVKSAGVRKISKAWRRTTIYR
jgi:hypothetical protein